MLRGEDAEPGRSRRTERAPSESSVEVSDASESMGFGFWTAQGGVKCSFFLQKITKLWKFWAVLLFPECVAKGSRLTLGGLGVEPCS